MENNSMESQSNNEEQLKEIALRAEKDALQYLELMARKYFSGNTTRDESDGQERYLMPEAFGIIEKAFKDLNIGSSDYDKKYYLEKFAITAGIDRPKY